MRGITTSAVQPIDVSVERLGAPGRGAILISALVIPFFVTAAFLSSMASAIDTTAGERERRSMETLLILPAQYAHIVLAKWAVTALVGIAGTVLTVGIGFTVLWFTPMPELGSKLFLSLSSAMQALVLLLPLTLAVSAVQLLIGFAAKTYKEGTSYLTLLSFLPLVAGLTALRASGSSAFPLPVFWEVAALRGPLLGAWPNPTLLFSGVIIDIALCVACLFACTLRLRDPRVLNTI
jgi:sodium transport system permease protein